MESLQFIHVEETTFAIALVGVVLFIADQDGGINNENPFSLSIYTPSALAGLTLDSSEVNPTAVATALDLLAMDRWALSLILFNVFS